MTDLLGILGTLADLALVIAGFSAIIFFHELGHFLAARWAGIRVLAFALGFGPAVVSYRKGLGLRRGSSEREYVRRLKSERAGLQGAGGVSPTEYRLNWLPFGGYVKMLGQEDLDPTATSREPDSYQNRPVWKRMVVISAGVAMNMLIAAGLFVVVFMVGLRTEPAKVGGVVPGLPASRATALGVGAREAGAPGLRAGDVIVAIDGSKPNSFNDLILATAMSREGEAVRVTVERPGVAGPLDFDIVPQKGRDSGLLEMGVEPARSAKLFETADAESRQAFRDILDGLGLAGVEPGMTLLSAGGKPVAGAHDLEEAARESVGANVPVEFGSPDGRRVSGSLTPRAELEEDQVVAAPGAVADVWHLLGLTPVMKVAAVSDRGERQGLRKGDVFARLGSVEFPSVAQGIAEIRSHRGREIPVAVMRDTGDGRGPVEVVVTPSPTVGSDGIIGFSAADSRDDDVLLARAPESFVPRTQGGTAVRPAAADLDLRPGSRILAVDTIPVTNFSELRQALRDLTGPAFVADTAATVELTVELPLPAREGAGRPTEKVGWTMPAAAVRRLHELSWESPLSRGMFEPEEFLLRASGPLQAISMGLRETHRVMLTTYITFARLFQGTVKVEHLHGPVGIAHLGTRIAERGFIWLLFFMALVSVNLAVVNFLPLPIADGGQFLFLVYEGVRGRPAPEFVQSAATLAGLVLIGAMFLIVTYNDIARLFGG